MNNLIRFEAMSGQDLEGQIKKWLERNKKGQNKGVMPRTGIKEFQFWFEHGPAGYKIIGELRTSIRQKKPLDFKLIRFDIGNYCMKDQIMKKCFGDSELYEKFLHLGNTIEVYFSAVFTLADSFETV